MAAALERVVLGRSNLKVSRVCLGCWQFNDGTMDASQTWSGQPFQVSKNIIDEALKCGINFLDTAEGYLNSEDVLGRILEGKNRSEIVLASKFGYGSEKKTGYTSADLIKSLNGSLNRLRTDYLDLYQVHWPPVIDGHTEEIVTELKRQQALGKIRYYGVSNFGVSDLEKFLAAGGEPITNQICYNMLSRQCEYEILPYCEEKGISVLPYSPLQQGLLSGKYLSVDDVPEGRRRTRHFASTSTSLSRHGTSGCEQELFLAINSIKNVCDRKNIQMSSTSLSWLLKQTGVASVVVGASTPEQVTANCKLTSVSDELDEELKRLTEPVKVALGNNCDLWAAPNESRVH